MDRSAFVSIDRGHGQGTQRREPLSFFALLSHGAHAPPNLLAPARADYATGLLRWGRRSFEARWLVVPGLALGAGSFTVDVSGRHAGEPGPGGASPRRPDIALAREPGGTEGQLTIHRLLDGRRRPGLALVGADWARFFDLWIPRSREGRPDRLWVTLAR